jgi:hypothetical protein
MMDGFTACLQIFPDGFYINIFYTPGKNLIDSIFLWKPKVEHVELFLPFYCIRFIFQFENLG